MTGAYGFTCQYKSTGALLARLRALKGWQWEMGDSHWYGDYLRCVPFPGVRIRICDFPKVHDGGYQYDADVRRTPECKTPMAVIDEAFRKVLAQLPAQDVKEIEWFD